MSDAFEYRQRAAQQRNAADSCNLPMVRDKFERAAERWEFLAEEIERCERGLLNLTQVERAAYH